MAAAGTTTDRPHSHGRFPGFDGLRAIAAFAVLLTHVADSGGANAPHLLGIFFARMDGGVAIFFVLSGLLLSRPFLRAALDDRPGPAVAPFLWRRALRIYPAYWLALTVIVFVFGNAEFPSLRNALLDYSLLHIYSPHQPDVFAPLIQSWTLSTEVAFYLFLPVWFALLDRLTRRGAAPVRTHLLGIVALALVSQAWKAAVLSGGVSDPRLGQLKMWLPWWLDLFAAGMLLALATVLVELRRWNPPAWLTAPWTPVGCWLAALGTLWWVSAGAGLPHTTGTIARHLLWGQHYLYGATAVLLIIPCTFGDQSAGTSRIRAFLASRVMVYLGTISYGIYLWHEGWIERYLVWTDLPYRGVYPSDVPVAWHTTSWFSLPWLTFGAVVILLTVASASLSWFGLERPLQRFRDLPPWRRRRPATAGTER